MSAVDKCVERHGEATVLARTPGLEPLDDFAALARLFVELGGDIGEVVDRPTVWLRCEVNRSAAGRAGEPVHVPKLTERFFRDLETLRVRTLELKEQLVEHGDGHSAAPDTPNKQARAELLESQRLDLSSLRSAGFFATGDAT